ncbi:MAG: hypothetical protein PHI85_04065 [Victivallaceae bacterium]|nr:hypothetical protein [Victivallaceae bacterium]
MMRIIMMSLSFLFAAAAAGCAATTSTISKYDAEGRLTRVSETSQSVVSSVVASTKDKLVLVNDQSMAIGLRALPPGSSTDAPSGTLELLFGRNDRVLLTVPPAMPAATVKAMASVIQASRAGEVNVSATGITAGGDK